MSAEKAAQWIREILLPAGVMVNGDMPWDIWVRDDRFYQRLLREGSLGAGEAYMDGWWECGRLDEMFARVMPTRLEDKVRKSGRFLLQMLGNMIFNPCRRSKAFEVGTCHYDKGNGLFRAMLDKRMIYSCAYWKDAGDLDEAQEAKLDLICRKMALKQGERILDIGCGWGGLAKYAAEHYGVMVVGITVSQQQAALAQEICRGLPIEIRLQDYRDLDETFDYIVSVGMFEHVGFRNYRLYMKKVHACLKEDGLFLLHTIGSDVSQHAIDPWTRKYIFPNSHIPSLKQISDSAEGLFVLEDLQNIGVHYDATLTAWFRNFDLNWDSLRQFYDARFYRMWKYYLLSCAGTFRARCLQVWQLVFSKHGVPRGYDPLWSHSRAQG